MAAESPQAASMVTRRLWPVWSVPTVATPIRLISVNAKSRLLRMLYRLGRGTAIKKFVDGLLASLCALGIVLSGGEFAVAQSNYFLTGEQLKKYCDQPGGSEAAFCAAYIMGAADSVTIYQATKIAKDVVCAPAETTGGIAKSLVINRMQSHPEDLKLPASYNVFLALKEAYPCPGQQ